MSELIVREALGERRFGASELPLAFGGAGSTVVVAGRPDDLIGLTTFANYPDRACTPTLNHHFLIEAEGRLMDIPGASITVHDVPEPPDGFRISHVDVVVRLVRKS